MSGVPVILVFFLICGISCAAFAMDRNRSQARWFLAGFLTGPLAFFVLLTLPVLTESERRVHMKRVIVGSLTALVVTALVAMGAAEFWERYEHGQRYAELENWQLYGDALIRFTKGTEHPSDAIVIKAAYNQIHEYERQLREGMRQTEDELLLAVQGTRVSRGAAGVLSSGLKFLTFRGFDWPARIPLSAREQEKRVFELKDRLRLYAEYLRVIEAGSAVTVAAPVTR